MSTNPLIRFARANRSLLITFIASVLVFTSFVFLTGAVYALWNTDRVYPGVFIGDIPVGGLTRDETRLVLSGLTPEAAVNPILVSLDSHQFALGGVWDTSSSTLNDLAHVAWLQGRNGSFWSNQVNRWQIALFGFHVEPPVQYPFDQTERLIATVSGSLEREGRPAISVGSVQVPALDGLMVDTNSLRQDINAAVVSGAQDRAIQVGLVRLAAPTVAHAPSNFVPNTIVVTEPELGLHLALDPHQLSLTTNAGEPHTLDLELLSAEVSRWQSLVVRPPREGQLVFDTKTNELRVEVESQPGLSLNVDGTALAIAEAVASGRSHAEMKVNFIEPVVSTVKPEMYGINGLISSGTTWFKGSTAERVANIQLTTESLQTVMVPPGGEFSFNENVGAITAANGYVDSAIIWGDRTAVGVGGGVCQVSTTVFRAALLGGFPITERYAHGYVVSWYGQPGKDATIYSPYVDFRFGNDTGAWILIQSKLDLGRGSLTFDIYGTAPDRTVSVSEPRISNVVEPEEPLFLEDPAIKPGEQEIAESEKLGMTVTVDRTITQNGQSQTEKFYSVYQPWRAVYLVGYEPEAEENAEDVGPSEESVPNQA